MSLFGDYDRHDTKFAVPSYGHPKDRRADLKQIQTGLGVTGDGGIPIFHRVFDGRAGEVNQVIGAMESLRSMCRQGRFLLVGDSKLISGPPGMNVGRFRDPRSDGVRVGGRGRWVRG